jgi:DNA/RNA endonuclease YhcR with UshA esterase domain
MRVSGWLNRKVAVATILAIVVAFSAGVAAWSYFSQTRAPVSVTTTVSVPFVASTNIVTTTSTSSIVLYSSTTATKSEWLPTTTQVVPWDQASNYVGQYVAVEGTIVYTYYSSYSGTYFLDFHNPYQGYFAGVIFSSGASSFTCSITDFYLNKDVRITGTIQLYNGQPQIIVSSPSQIEVAYRGFPCS